MQVVLVGATNRLDLLDDALLRPGRFDELLEVAPPDESGRLQVLTIHTRGTPLADDVDLESFAVRSAGCSGAQLHAICREAAMHALREDLAAEMVCTHHFEAALRNVVWHT
uniref:Vesicle-fusing ATPase n=1 Tax=Coccolithus braarudii TaxID=221442 RepID=A0A7S0LBW6_9EUKA|mmetsp:Transcript_32099/g.68997  ORF Transcript_32099/g.68997 Transcript_32099/m.68997 type:complete len:111 (+) Transcript_32099:45-377(+)